MGRSVRAENKVPFNTYIDKDLKARFKKATEQNKDSMVDVVVQAIENYLKYNEQVIIPK